MIRPLLYYGCEGWTLNKKEESVINSFERKLLRRIYGPIKENGIWRIRYNGKPRTRWIDAVEEDAKKLMGVRNWKRAAQDRGIRGLMRKAKARHRALAP
ncbi:hypothetical protein B7P43_G17989 [Cryptotermes secundus]|uniref:Endonuclease-reverse transcriptase n=1 Tax=Cryptotermes secundus TaxID=105785 RepID=A0A2J7PBA3_9NEOP|nr:hypothetical protein B7P43_G17989 [Cryptotermes secundus]